MNRLIRCISLTLVFLIVSMWAILFFMPLPPLLQGMDFSRVVYDEHHQLLRLTLSRDAKYRLYTPLTKISPHLVSATLLEEDQYFYRHPGINPASLFKAITYTYFSGKRRIGASTITMQVARVRYGINSRSVTGKLWQIIRALQLEMHYTKNEILEAYFNLVSYGHNIEGAGAASLVYFGKPVSELVLPEALTLAVIPQHPAKRVPHAGKLAEVRFQLFQRWLLQHPEDTNEKPLFDLPLQMRSLHAMPFRAPHFVNEILSSPSIKANEVETSLDLHLQTLIERITRQYIARKKNLGAHNAAILLIDTRDMGIKAMLGSADFFNEKISGQINGTNIRRSPGSTLKPFIYALAIDQGLIHPATILKDVPQSFGSYNPENFDNDFAGPISAKDALITSRNIPAIYLADQLKNPSLYDFLQAANVKKLKSEKYYGLALVLGGAELSMWELAELYATIANEGIWQPLRFKQESIHQLQPNKRLLSPEAAYLVMDMLKETPAPAESFSSRKQQSFAFKTGTSSGYRDAWTIGITGPYVLAVWLGNFDNAASPVFVGKKIAAPLFFEIANALAVENEFAAMQHYPDRMNLVKTDICKASGLLPTRYCPFTEKVWFIPGKSPIQTDTVYREIAINSKTGMRACKFDANTRFEVYEFWSSDLLRIFRRAGIARRLPPAYDTHCTMGSKSNEGFAPQIISPQKQVNYVARIESAKENIIPLSAVVDADVKNVYWFMDNIFLGKTTRDKSFLWQARRGKHVVRVVDDYGRSDARDMIVKAEI